MTRLQVGESSPPLRIQARKFWNHTGLIVEADAQYLFKAEGVWHDWYVATNADGYEPPLFRPARGQRRSPADPWFCLTGAVATDDALPDEWPPFALGSRRTISVPVTGELICFANDIFWLYWNNWGAVTLTVTRQT